MNSETERNKSLLDHYNHLFVADPTQWALGRQDGHYMRVSRPFTTRVRDRLIAGNLTAALYMLTPEGQSIQGVADSDTPQGLVELQRVALKLRDAGLTPILEASNKGRAHLRVCHEPMDPTVTTQLLRKGLSLAEVEAEVFPKGRGLSCVRALFGRHLKTAVQYPLVDLDTLAPVAPTIGGQLEYLATLERATPQMMAEALARVVEEAGRPKLQPRPWDGAADLKRDLDILEIVGRDRDVRKIGRHHFALCPWHDDHRPSLVIYPATQTFHCFGCGRTGDAIRYLALRQGIRDGEVMAQLRKK